MRFNIGDKIWFKNFEDLEEEYSLRFNLNQNYFKGWGKSTFITSVYKNNGSTVYSVTINDREFSFTMVDVFIDIQKMRNEKIDNILQS